MYFSLILNAKLVPKVNLKDIEEKNHGFEKSGALQIPILRKVSRSVAFQAKWVGNHFYINSY